ncbi:MAG: hypothetical protein Q9167_005404 [Letrouitia subvulpina]
MTDDDDSIRTKNLVNDIDELLQGFMNDGAKGHLQEIIDEYILSWNGDAGCIQARENMPQLVPVTPTDRMQQDAEQTIENLLDDYADYFATQEQEVGQNNCHDDKYADIAEPIRYRDCKLSNVRSKEW